MEHTTKYGFNLLQGTDPISPKPLNDNMKKVETAFNDAEEKMLKQVGTGGKNARIAFGTYDGTGVSGKTFTFTTGFKPVLLVVTEVTKSYATQYESHAAPAVAVRPTLSTPLTAWGGHYLGRAVLGWKDDAVEWQPVGVTDSGEPFYAPGADYAWMAVGYDAGTEV